MGVSNAEIHVDGPEIPAGDGSSAEFVAAIVACGLEMQAGAAQGAWRSTRRFWLRDPATG